MRVKNYDTNHLAAVEALNKHVGEVMWYEFYRDEFRACGGRREVCSATLERIINHFPDCVKWVPVARFGQVMMCKVEVIKAIRLE